MFIATVLQAAVITVGLIGMYNAYSYSHYCINAVNNGNRFIYRTDSDYSHTMPGISYDHYGYIKETDEIMSDNPHYLGVSVISRGALYTEYNKLLETTLKSNNGEPLTEDDYIGVSDRDAGAVFYYDTLTLQSISCPLSKGEWDLFEEKDGKIPCVIGGKYADEYKVGDVLNYYTVKEGGEGAVQVDYVVAGILK